MRENAISITGLHLVPKRSEGRRTIAYFDVCLAGMIELHEFSLIRTAADGLTIMPPALTKAERRRSVTIPDSALFQAIQAAARHAYNALGGTDLPEWARKERPEPLANLPKVEDEAA